MKKPANTLPQSEGVEEKLKAEPNYLLVEKTQSYQGRKLRPIINQVGARSGKLIALEMVKIDKRWHYKCLCDCGNITMIQRSWFGGLRKRSCGCLRRTSMEKIEARFWEHVDRRGEDDCWLWRFGKNACGYGTFGVARRSQLAHRVAWGFEFGEIPKGICVLHKCDNPPCCNPAHLFLGTQQENIADMNAKGRQRAPRKMREDDVRFIRHYYYQLREGIGRKALQPGRLDALVDIYAVDRSVITRIVQGNDPKSWRHVK